MILVLKKKRGKKKVTSGTVILPKTYALLTFRILVQGLTTNSLFVLLLNLKMESLHRKDLPHRVFPHRVLAQRVSHTGSFHI